MDIVERLRGKKWCVQDAGRLLVDDAPEEAAAEIEALRAQIAQKDAAIEKQCREWQARAERAEAALAETRRQLLHALLPQYRADRVAIAKLCDETIDRSGRLLGELRALAQGEGQ